MAGLFDSATLDLPCDCGKTHQKTIGWVKTHKQFVCLCGTTINIDASDLTREMGKVDAAVADLTNTFKRIGNIRIG